MANKTYVTKDKLNEIEEEYNRLRTKGRKDIANKIAEARSHGDLSENADYDAAKDEQALLEMRIRKLQNMLANSEVIDPKDFPDDKVYILSIVKLKNLSTGSIVEYTLVSPEEADFELRKLSVTSPIGKAIMGKNIGDVIEVNIPAGLIKYEVIGISKS